MKRLKAPFLAVIVLLFSVSFAFAETPPPPAPTAKGAATTASACPFCPVGSPLPIDQNIVLLAISGLALGLAVIYKNKIKKASV